MIEHAHFWGGYWWLLPMIMMLFCFFGMRRFRLTGNAEGFRGCWRPRESGGPSALEILSRRYAGGEIDREEYEQKRRDIAGDQVSQS